MPFQSAKVGLGKAQNLFPLDLEFYRVQILLFVSSPLQKHFIQFDRCVHVKMGIEQAHMDPGLEGGVETSDTVGSQE